MNRKLLLLALAVLSSAAQAETLIAIRESDLHLIAFDSATPGTIAGDLAMTGFPTNVIPIAMDFRPATNALILVGMGPTNGNCQLYTVSTLNGAVTSTGAAFSCPSINEIDFNPVVDRIRVISDTDNYRVNPNDGVRTADTAAAYVAGDIGAGSTPSISGSAYDQNIAGTATTTLFALDGTRDTLVRVGSVNGNPTSPNTGQLTTIGALGVDLSGSAPFDISPAGTAYLFTFDPPFAPGVNGKLRTVNLATGAATTGVKVGTSSLNLLGMTVAPGVTLNPAAAVTVGTDGGAVGGGLLVGLFGLALARIRRRSL